MAEATDVELRDWTTTERDAARKRVALPGTGLSLSQRRLDAADLSAVLANAGVRLEHMRLDACVVDGDLDVAGLTIGEVEISGEIRGSLEFQDCAFEHEFNLNRLVVSGITAFYDSEFQGPVLFSRARHDRMLRFMRVTVQRYALLQCAGRAIEMHWTRFEQGIDLFARHAVVFAEHAHFGAASLIAASSHRGPPDDDLRRTGGDERPRVESLRRSDVGNLLLSNVDLAGCRFYGAHRLHELRIDGNPTFATSPDTWRHTRRSIIAEEADLRPGWETDRTRPTYPEAWRVETRISESDVADLYRSLRRGLEARGNEPGAADFYYGEMEMRRRGEGPLGERVLLWLYWATAGYGLRATRAIASLVLIVAALAVAYRFFGFAPNPTWGRAWLFSIESTSSLFRTAPTQGLELTAAGELLQVLERLLGPLFLGLIVLSIRGRVKR